MPRTSRESTFEPNPPKPLNEICSINPDSVVVADPGKLRGASMVRCHNNFTAKQQLAKLNPAKDSII